MRISVVIPTFNRAWIFERSIPAFMNQTTGDFSYEVIFVANGSTDDTDSILKSAAARSPELFRYYWIPPTGGPSAPRNRGIREATGDIIIITDDDVIPDPDFILRHAEFHQRYQRANEAAVGQVYVPKDLLGDPMSLFHEHYSYDRRQNLDSLTFFDFWTCNVSFKRQFMLDHGMFNETLMSMEDVEVAHRLERAGMHLYFLPGSRGQHLHESNPATLAAKASLFGTWMYHLTLYVPPELVKKRFGVVTMAFGPVWFLKRLARMIGYGIFDNPATRGVLCLLGATRSRRSRITDIYYGLLFRRAFFAGYYRALLQARRDQRRVRTNEVTECGGN